MSDMECTNKSKEIHAMLTEMVEAANEECQFSQRNTRLNASRFVQTLVLGWLQKGDASLNELAHLARALDIEVTGSALHERMGGKAVQLLQKVFRQSLQNTSHMTRLDVDALQPFEAVHVTDSTQIRLPQTLESWFADTVIKIKPK